MATQNAQIRDRIIGLLAEYADDGAAIDGNTDLVADLNLESVRILEFIVDVEDAFDVIIDIESLSDVHTVDELAATVAQVSGAG